MKEDDKNGRYEDEYGTVRWYKDGQFHREDGPAFMHNSGIKTWFLNGIECSEELFNKYLLNKKLQSKLEEKSSVKRLKI